MKEQTFTVHLYYTGEMSDETKHTTSLDQARRWVADAAHGTIINQNQILIQ